MKHSSPKKGGLQLKRKVGQGFSIFIEGIEVKIELRSISGTWAQLSIIGDPEKVVIRREEQLLKDSAWQE